MSKRQGERSIVFARRLHQRYDEDGDDDDEEEEERYSVA